MSTKKGQLFSMDASLSMIVFIVILIFIILIWNIYSHRLEERVQEEEMQLAAMQALDVLTKTWGVPSNWEKDPANVVTLGIRRNPGSLDNEKVNALDTSINPTDFGKKLNIDRYYYSFRILDSQGNAVVLKEKLPPVNEKTKLTISVSSFMYHQGENREVVLTLRQ